MDRYEACFSAQFASFSLIFFSCIAIQSKPCKMFAPTLQPPGLQGQKFFASAIINFLIPFKYISDENSYNQLFINRVVKIFTFQFDESVIKFHLVNFFSDFDEILVSCAQIS